jgi:hypothetical protein
LGLTGLTAIYVQRISWDPVNQAMLDLGIATTTVEGEVRDIELTEPEYDDVPRIAGRLAKMRLDTVFSS